MVQGIDKDYLVQVATMMKTKCPYLLNSLKPGFEILNSHCVPSFQVVREIVDFLCYLRKYPYLLCKPSLLIALTRVLKPVMQRIPVELSLVLLLIAQSRSIVACH